MALIEEFESQGDWLFRWRSFVPLIFIPLLYLGVWEYVHDGSFLDHIISRDSWIWLSLGVSALGLLYRGIVITYTHQRTSGRNTAEQIADSLNTRGMYSTVVRHPLYFGNFLMGLGAFMFTGIWYIILLYILIYWLYYERIMFREEAFLRSKFGEQYTQWAAKVPAFLPRLGQWQKPDVRTPLRNVISRENHGFFAIILSFTILVALEGRLAEGAWALPASWKSLLLYGFIVYAVIRLFDLPGIINKLRKK